LNRTTNERKQRYTILKMERENINTFYKAVDEIQSLHRAEVLGNLSDYFEHRITDKNHIIWIKDPGTIIRNNVIEAAHKYLI